MSHHRTREVDCPACQAGEPCAVRAAAEAAIARLEAPDQEAVPAPEDR